jgi:hypothetical protein
MKRFKQLPLSEKIPIVLLLVIFGGIVLHAPISVGLSVLFPDFVFIIKSWKEILMLIATILLAITLRRKWGTKPLKVPRSPLFLLIVGYIDLHLLSFIIFGAGQSITSMLAGLLIDLRYIGFFVLIYIVLRMYPWLRRSSLQVGLIGALVVVIFGLLQVFVLPADFLKYIGYSTDTIVPYLTVDQNSVFIRISSTLRGPNPLGAYVGIMLTLLVAFWLKGNHAALKRPIPIVAILGIGGLTALWFSYSRTALIAAVVGIGVVLGATVARRLPKWGWVALVIVAGALIGGLAASRGTSFVSNVLLHENTTGGSAVSSNDGHVESLQDGLGRLLVQPFGAGVGSTGSASLYGSSPLIIENQYLFIAHEVGWLGLIVFVAIFVIVLKKLWQRRADWLALGVFASGIGMALIGLLLPVWVDDTVAIIWWGLAGLALARGIEVKK